MDQDETVFYFRVGEEFFPYLVERFYHQVADDELLGPMYPPDDLEGAQKRLSDFLIQYWGGPKTYGQTRGHPRLYMRHSAFPIDEAARDRWLDLMQAALDQTCQKYPISAEDRAQLWDYLERAAWAMVNQRPGPSLL